MTTNQHEYAHPEHLVETEWLEQHLDDINLKVFDCTVNILPNPDQEQSSSIPFIFKSGRDDYNQGHVPRAGFFDISGELTDLSASVPLMMPSEEQFTKVMGNYGINDNTQVVLYSCSDPNWAARAWWMLRAFGFDNAAILNGGWSKWTQEKKPVSNAACNYTKASFVPRPRSSVFVGKQDVLQEINNDHTRIICALPPAMYSGVSDIKFGRKGRVAGSVNVPFASLHNPETGVYLPADQLQENFDRVEVDAAENIITYCGGGIAASNNAFVLNLLGYDNVAVYDGSMLEWGNDLLLPMEADK